MTADDPVRPSPSRTAVLLIAVIVLAAAVLVFASLRRPEPPAYPPTTAQPADVGDRLVGPERFTVDATSSDDWRFFQFSTGALLERPAPLDWDIAFRRFHVITNGGDGFAGDAGVIDLGAVTFDSVMTAPTGGYQATAVRSDSVNEAVSRWYDYGFFSHLLTPKPHVFAIRTADGRYAKFEFLSYYCPGAQPGCPTFRYVYQGDGSTSFAR